MQSKTFCCTISPTSSGFATQWSSFHQRSSKCSWILLRLVSKKNHGEADHRFCQTSMSFWQEITGATHSSATKPWIEPCCNQWAPNEATNVATKLASSSSSWTPPNSIMPARIACKQSDKDFVLKSYKSLVHKRYTRQDLDKNVLQSMKSPENYEVLSVTVFGLDACAIDQTPSCLRQVTSEHVGVLQDSMLLMR